MVNPFVNIGETHNRLYKTDDLVHHEADGNLTSDLQSSNSASQDSVIPHETHFEGFIHVQSLATVPNKSDASDHPWVQLTQCKIHGFTRVDLKFPLGLLRRR